MGDFAAGKMLENPGVVQVEDVTPETFGQFITDIEQKFVELGGEGEDSPFARMGPAVDVQGVEDPLLAALLSWHNGGVPLGDHFTLSVEEFSALGAPANLDVWVASPLADPRWIETRLRRRK